MEGWLIMYHLKLLEWLWGPAMSMLNVCSWRNSCSWWWFGWFLSSLAVLHSHLILLFPPRYTLNKNVSKHRWSYLMYKGTILNYLFLFFVNTMMMSVIMPSVIPLTSCPQILILSGYVVYLWLNVSGMHFPLSLLALISLVNQARL